MLKQVFIGLMLVGCVFGVDTIINDGKYHLHSHVEGSELHIMITAETTGYIGFGISETGTMLGADIIISGYNSDSMEGYAADYHGVNNTMPELDTNQNVRLLEASENGTHTTVSFMRPLDATDEGEDLPIMDTVQQVIWSMGETDELEYHGEERGLVELNLMS